MAWDILNQGDPFDEEDVYLQDGQLTERAIEVFASGDCWYLAWVLHQKLADSELVIWVSAEDRDILFHALIRQGNGRMLDIFGDEDEFTKRGRYPERDLRTYDLGRAELATYSHYVHGIPTFTQDDIPAEFATWTDQVADHLIAALNG